MQVVGFRVKNTHNHIWNDYSTKKVNLKKTEIMTLFFTSFEFGCGIGSLSSLGTVTKTRFCKNIYIYTKQTKNRCWKKLIPKSNQNSEDMNEMK